MPHHPDHEEDEEAVGKADAKQSVHVECSLFIMVLDDKGG